MLPTSTDLCALFQNVPTTGDNGFEGLVCQLMEKLTGWRFALARSGDQHGRDAGSVRRRANNVAVETKRYTAKQLGARELLGELAEAAADWPTLDIWIVASLAPVSDQLRTALERDGAGRGIDIVTIGTEGATLSDFEAFVAADEELTRSFFPREHRDQVATMLAACRAHQDYEKVLDRLRTRLRDYGYSSIAAKSAHQFLQQTSSADSSRQAFGQRLGVNSAEDRFIQRNVAAQLDTWWNDFRDSEPCRALVGAEGTGKSWLAFGWVSRILKLEESPPIVLPVTSKTAAELEDPRTFLSARLHALEPSVPVSGWCRKLDAWNNRGVGSSPLMLLVLDGLNERPDLPWKSALRWATGSPWSGIVATLCTCRDSLRGLLAEVGLSGKRIVHVSGYEDSELLDAFGDDQVDENVLAASVQALVRRPRYFALVSRIPRSEWPSLTVERILYQDWRDRRYRKDGIEISDDQFLSLLVTAAKQVSEKTQLDEHAIHTLLPPYTRAPAAQLAELMDGGIFERTAGLLQRFKLNPKMFALAFGVILVDALSGADSEKKEGVVESFCATFDGTDLEAHVLGAACHLAVQGAATESDRRLLLREWLRVRNVSSPAADSMCRLARTSLDDYLHLVPEFWASGERAAQERIATALLLAREDGDQQELANAIDQWCGFVCPTDQGSEEERARQSASIRRLGLVADQPTRIASMLFTLKEAPGIVRLHRLALLLISAGDATPFLQSIIRLHISRSIVGSLWPDADACWLLRLGSAALRERALERASKLLEHADVAVSNAAYALLTAVGTPESIRTRASMNPPWPADPREEEWIKNPCRSPRAWPREHVEECSGAQHLSGDALAFRLFHWAPDQELTFAPSCTAKIVEATRRKLPAVLLNDREVQGYRFRHNLELMLARLAPREFAMWFRTALAQIALLPVAELRRFAQRLEHYLLLLDESSVETLKHLRKRIEQENVADPEKTFVVALQESEVLRAILAAVDARTGFDVLVRRPSCAFDNWDLETFFRRLPTGAEVLNLLHEESPREELVRALWYMAVTRPKLDPDARSWLTEHLVDDDLTIRTLVHRVVDAYEDEALSNSCLATGLEYSKSHTVLTDALGARILARSTVATYSAVKERLGVHGRVSFVTSMGRANDNELLECAADLDGAWPGIADASRSSEGELPGVMVDTTPPEPPRTARPTVQQPDRTLTFVASDSVWGGELDGADGAPWRDEDLAHYTALDEVVDRAWSNMPTAWWGIAFPPLFFQRLTRLDPNRVKGWARAALDAVKIDAVRSRTWTFYTALCRGLLLAGWEEGAELWKASRFLETEIKVRSAIGIPWRTLALFEADSDGARGLRAELMRSATNDADLLEISVAALQHGRQLWLRDWVDQMMSGEQADCARATTVSAFCGLPEPQQWTPVAAIDGSFERLVRDGVAEHRRRDGSARHWYREFLRCDDRVGAWAALRLFAETVDLRCEVWMRQVRGQLRGDHEERDRYVEAIASLLQDRIDKRAKELKKKFFGIDLRNPQILPFTRRPRILTNI